MTDERPPALEEVERKPKTQEEKFSQVESELVMFKNTKRILRHPKWIEQLMCSAFKSERVA